MEVDKAEEVVLTESQKVWREVKECLGSEDFDKAIQLCNTGETNTLLLCLGCSDLTCEQQEHTSVKSRQFHSPTHVLYVRRAR